MALLNEANFHMGPSQVFDFNSTVFHNNCNSGQQQKAQQHRSNRKKQSQQQQQRVASLAPTTVAEMPPSVALPASACLTGTAATKAGPPGTFATPFPQPMQVSAPPSLHEAKNSTLDSQPFQFKASLADRLAASNLELDFELYCPSSKAQGQQPPQHPHQHQQHSDTAHMAAVPRAGAAGYHGLRLEDEEESNSSESNRSYQSSNQRSNQRSKHHLKTKQSPHAAANIATPSTAAPTSDLESCIAELLRKHMMPETGSQEGQSSSGDMTPYSDEGSSSLPMLLRRTLTATTFASEGAASDSMAPTTNGTGSQWAGQNFGLAQFANGIATTSTVFSATPTMAPLTPISAAPLGRGHCLGLSNPCHQKSEKSCSFTNDNDSNSNDNNSSGNLLGGYPDSSLFGGDNTVAILAPFASLASLDSPLLSADDAPPGLGGNLCPPLPAAFPAMTPTTSATVAAAAPASVAAAATPATPPAVPAGKFTTVMLRNIPSKLTQRQLMKQVSSMGYRGKFDFLYIPMDSRRRSNRGIAFINFSSPAAAKGFIAAVQEQDMNAEAPSAIKGVEVLAADVQGFDKNVEWHAETLLSKTETHKPLVLRRVSFPKLAQVVAEAAEKKSTNTKAATTVAPAKGSNVPAMSTDACEAEGRLGPRPPRTPEVSAAQLQRSISGSSSFSGSGSTGSTASAL